MIFQELTTAKTTTSIVGKELPVQISVAYARCPFIDRSNITFTGLGFHGIPDHLVLSVAGSLTIITIFLILKKIAWEQHKSAQSEILEIGDVDILNRCGVDAMQYLAFHRYIMYYMIVNALICICVILPTNLGGDMGKKFNCF
ncbi:CSC1-like protein 1 [Trichonephila inaurata madagascariensis]|uniref:CSC1-like protein 1 n=1 Tax=Trichonephila inaurata madagascariensis TaxID=2747483 RepID=A0A8X6XML7_9ARAC|nr:CSC1-like protein 1 [Trichonephila inaurata madagascariensis]